MFQWSDEEVDSSLLNPRDRDAKTYLTHRELKMDIFSDIIDYLDRGKVRHLDFFHHNTCEL